MSIVDRRIKNLFAVQMRLGLFDPLADQPYASLTPATDVATPAATQLALEAARQSLVLLRNSNHVLPFDPDRIRHVAVVGRRKGVEGLFWLRRV